LIFVFALIAEIIGTTAGFGSSTIFLPLALIYFDFGEALAIVGIFHMFGNLGRLAFFKKGLDWKLFAKFGVPSVILTFIGAYIASTVSGIGDFLKIVLGAFLVLYSVYSYAKPKFSFKPEARVAVVGGAISGFFAGLIGTGGAIRGAFLTAFGEKKEAYIATAAAISIATDFVRVPVYIFGGLLHEDKYWMLPILFVIAFLGAYIGKNIVGKIGEGAFRKFVLIVILLAGIKIAYDGIAAAGII